MTDSALIVSVAVPTPLRRTFQYRVADHQTVRVGSRVLVSFSNRQLTGVVVSTEDTAEIDTGRIKHIERVHSSAGDLPHSIMRLCNWAAAYYAHSPGDVYATAMPGLVSSGWNPMEPASCLELTAEAPAPDSLKRSPAQRALLELLQGGPVLKDSLKAADISSRTIKTLTDKAWARWETIDPPPGETFQLKQVNNPVISLTDEQVTAISAAKERQTTLLKGITGSGKTEVYLRVIEPLLRQGKQVIVLVPEIGLTPQTISRFQDRFDVPLAVMHSSLSDRQRAENWFKAKEGQVGIVLGTRSAVFTPMKSPGAIIVDEEHDSSYKQHEGFRYSARDLAVLRGSFEGIPVILGSATPSLESLHNVETGKYQAVSLSERAPGASTESYEVIDTRHLEVIDGFTRMLKRRIGEELARDNQVLIFLNRRGFAPVMMCQSCEWIAQCRRCDAKLTYHLPLNTLVCHHCGSMSHNIISCQSCGSREVAAIGQGTQRIEKTLAELFPDYPVLRIDRDSTRKKGAMDAYLEKVASGAPCLLVGTQMLAKGHHFPNVTLVALMDVDSGFYSSDFRAVERLGQLILQVGGRAGRAEKPGEVLLQTEFAHHPLLQLLIEEGYEAFAAAVLAERKSVELPPYAFSCVIRAEAHQSSTASSFLSEVLESARPHPSVNVSGPIPALMEKRAGRFRHLLLLTAADRGLLHQEIERRIAIAESLPAGRKVRWSVDVDPVDLF